MYLQLLLFFVFLYFYHVKCHFRIFLLQNQHLLQIFSIFAVKMKFSDLSIQLFMFLCVIFFWLFLASSNNDFETYIFIENGRKTYPKFTKSFFFNDSINEILLVNFYKIIFTIFQCCCFLLILQNECIFE